MMVEKGRKTINLMGKCLVPFANLSKRGILYQKYLEFLARFIFGIIYFLF